MSNKKIAFLVDFDNVATDVIEQALNAVFKDYGAAHIRRAYCNAEQALREQNFLKRLGLRAIVNLAIGKNSTDIALAVDAMDLAITEKPDVIVLVSSDSDFAPLVLRLREKGAWLRGFGQYGKTGDGVIQIYDQFNELAHAGGARAGRDGATSKPAGRDGATSKPAGRNGAAPKPAGRNGQRGQRERAATPRPAQEPLRVAPPAAVEPAPPAVSVEVTAPAVAAASTSAAVPAAAVSRKAAAKATSPKPAPRSAAPAPDKNVAAAREINAILAALPKLADGQWHDLAAAAKALKDAGLSPKSAPSAKLFRKHPHAFQLQPEKQPNQVRFGHG